MIVATLAGMITNTTSLSPGASGIMEVGGQMLHYIKVGNGAKLVLTFHGYGNDASIFGFLNDPDYTVLSFDLPFQGQSVGVKDVILHKADMNKLVQDLMKEYEVQKIGLAGFSLGARVCLCIVEQNPDCVRNMVLVAPDGIRHNYFYQFLTATLFGRFLFRSFVKFGKGYLKLFSFLYGVGILNRYRYRFAMQYIRTPESRELLYNIWINTSLIVPRLKKIRQHISNHHLPVHILVGRKDQVIPLDHAVRFKGHSEDIALHVFERGHNLLSFEEVKGTLAAWLFRTPQVHRSI